MQSEGSPPSDRLHSSAEAEESNEMLALIKPSCLPPRAAPAAAARQRGTAAAAGQRGDSLPLAQLRSTAAGQQREQPLLQSRPAVAGGVPSGANIVLGSSRSSRTERASPSVRAPSSSSASGTSTAQQAHHIKREGNIKGDFWVDSTCINCDLCRRMSPCFTQNGDGSAVTVEPRGTEQRVDAMMALVSCPTFSIHCDSIVKSELKAAHDNLPRLVPGCKDVFHCGWHSEKSFSAAAYLIRRPEGNILVDSPRFNPILVKKIEAMGGVSCMFLTHRDDVADHEKWAKHFGCPRVLHSLEIREGTKDVEVVLEGEGPWDLQGSTVPDLSGGNGGGDVTLQLTPGHTEGHVCLLYAPDQALLSGDHISQEDSEPDGFVGANLYIFKDINWYSVPEQLKSVAKLRDFDFTHVIPGHGRVGRLRDGAHRRQAIDTLLQEHGYQHGSGQQG